MQKQRNWFLVPLVIFTCCYFAVGYYNRFASDDFEFLNKLREYGYFGSVQWFHSHWNTRWSAIGLLNGVLLFTLNAGTLFYYHLVSIVLLWYAFYRIIQSVLAQDKLTGGIMAGYATTAFFYSCFSINDVFFWINTSTMYLYGCIALLFAIAELTTRKHTFFSYVRLSLFGLFIAGAYEPLVITAGVTCIFLLAIPL